MPEEDSKPTVIQQGDPLTIKFWLIWLAQQGIAIIVLVGVTVALGYYLYKIIPEKDAAANKANQELAEKFLKELEDRDKRFLEYRTKADEKTAQTIKELLAAKDKDIDRVVSLLTSRINDIQKSTERTAQKVDAALTTP